ncbi:ribonuclease H2, subunit B [Hypoxylon rubiginosum]|uniref:Ribonuclease H2, subunit B n=1 Tax=Hypoxylon rubiginosum TaxID=110542 RepID=A0ACC0CNQ6_9PEZI|nr:ribonuclease H2, subunit B [Hypoxylon rubiginosum]
MARTTRSKASASAAEASDSKSKSTANSNTQSRYTLPAESTKPPIVFVLPKKATKDAKIVSLYNPRYQTPMRYLVCPETGIYEFTSIVAPKSTPKSWFIECGNGDSAQPKTSDDNSEFRAYVTNGAELYVATPFDPMFLLLAAFADQSASTKDGKRMFVFIDDHLDSIRDKSPHLSEILRWGKTRTLLESRMAAVCDTVEAGDETMFRFNEDKMATEMLAKAQNICEHGLPQSLEEKYVTKKLEAPLMAVKKEATIISTTQEQTQVETSTPASGASTPKVESADSQSSVSSTETTTTSASEAPTAATSVAEESTTTTVTNATMTELAPAMLASEEIVKLQRLRGALQFMCAKYMSKEHGVLLFSKLKTQVDFAPLDAYLEKLNTLRQEAAVARSLTDYSRKRPLDDEEAAERAEKKRRKDEAEKRKKAGESRAVRDLKKVSTTGMKKMSDFFKKK